MSRLIAGVEVKRLKPVPDERGRVVEILRADDPLFTKFGQATLTTAHPGAVKAWRTHLAQVNALAVLSGMVKLVLFDDRDDSETRGETNEFFAGDHNPILVKVPAGVTHGFKSVGSVEALVLNIASEPYRAKDPDETRLDPVLNEIPYDWDRRDG
jgi:dTDP-4-dehydrorhamnose 3,5-epimerase